MGLRKSVFGVASSLVGLARTRLELLALEAAGEKARLLKLLGMAFAALLFLTLAVSVVPKERAGMATGIFNAVRLAGDGMAIAVVGAMLSANILSGLAASVPEGSVAAADLVQASNRLAMSDLQNALAHLPRAGRSLLLQAYESAFRFQLLVLAGAAAGTAILVFMLLGRVKRPA